MKAPRTVAIIFRVTAGEHKILKRAAAHSLVSRSLSDYARGAALERANQDRRLQFEINLKENIKWPKERSAPSKVRHVKA